MYVTSPVGMIDTQDVLSTRYLEAGQRKHSHSSTVRTGHRLFCEGDDADYIFEIVEGVVRTSKLLFDGRRLVISFGYPGDIVGFSHDNFFHSDCEAISSVRLRVHHKNAHSASFKSKSGFSSRLLRLAAAEINNMQEHFIMLGRKSATEKVASFLVTLLERTGEKAGGLSCFDLPMCRSDIADFLGLSHETVSRVLARLRKDGIIDLPKMYRVRVHKPLTLRKIAEQE